jgi:hypothetical protein
MRVEGDKRMVKPVLSRIQDLDFIFENSLIKVTANRNCPEIKLAGLTVGPFEEGNEYEVCYWIATELAKSGTVRFHAQDLLDATKLSKIQWTERVQTAGQISKLSEGFYPKLRRYLVELREGISNNPERMREYERVDHLTKDIVNSRMKKIISIASAPAQTESALRNLTAEERLLYEQFFQVINSWKTRILEQTGANVNG